MTSMRVLITGANGFVGKILCDTALARGAEVLGMVRKPCHLPKGVQIQLIKDWGEPVKMGSALKGVSAIIHAAARAHIVEEPGQNSLADFRKVNVESTLNLARQAVVAGVRRFVFISSIGVNGAETFAQPFSASDSPMPQSAYAASKHAAEQGLQALAAETGLEVVIIRPPLVYGPQAPGNFRALVRLVSSGWPLPFGCVTSNRRSFVAVDNLADLILTCLDHPAATNKTFLVSDGEDLSTADLVRRLGSAMGITVRLLPIPVGALALGAKLLGKLEKFQSLCGSLQVDISETKELLGWYPPIRVDEGLKRAVEDQRC
jgi:nucleoside-diphosphate-sugar epimerase